MPTQYVRFIDKTHRLLWLLIGVLLVIGALSVTASAILPAMLERWLGERGLEAEVEQVRFSPLHLSVHASGLRLRNREGRGFDARHASLQFSWRQLLRGRLHLRQLELDGAALDIQSRLEEGTRRWEIAGWELGTDPPGDRDWQLPLARVRLRDSEVCYRHLPQWHTASCAKFSDLLAIDLRLAGRGRAGEPLQLEIGARDLTLRGLTAQNRDAHTAHTALVELRLSRARYTRADHRIAAAGVQVRRFASCTPALWAEALPVLGRLVGHCAAAQRLQIDGGAGDPVQFTFGAGAEVHWRRASGQEVLLRYANRRHANWRARTIAINDFRFLRGAQHLSWQRAGASGFDWCPNQWRDREHHYCLRAGSLRLPRETRFDWVGPLDVRAPEGRLQQTRLLDMAAPNPNPLTVMDARIGALNYRGASRSLELASLRLDSAAGCVPGGLWQQPEHCLQLRQLRADEPLKIAFPWAARERPLGFSGGRFALARLELERAGERQFQLEDLQWQSANLLRDGRPLSLENFSLQYLAGCLPDAVLPQRFRPLCARVENLAGRGNFLLHPGADAYAVFGELQLDSLQLADSSAADRGLRLQHLRGGSGFFRVDHRNEIPAQLAAGVDATAEGEDEKSAAPAAPGPPPGTWAGIAGLESSNLQLRDFSLSRLQGCMPPAWFRLIFDQRAGMPECFEVQNLRQHRPLALRWREGLAVSAAQLTLERALVRARSGDSLLDIYGLRLPTADIRLLPGEGDWRLALPGFALDRFRGCLPRDPPARAGGCLDLEMLRLGDNFHARERGGALSVDLRGLVLNRLLLTGREEEFIAHVEQLLLPALTLDLPRGEGFEIAQAALHLDNLQAARLDTCLPLQMQTGGDWPRCVSARDIHSTDTPAGTGLSLRQLELKESPVAQPLLTAAQLQLREIALRRDPHIALELRGLELEKLSACGLLPHLPPWAASAGLGDCVQLAALQLPGDNRIRLTPGARGVDLGPLHTSAIELTTAPGRPPSLSLQGVQWQSLDAGPDGLRVADLRALGFSGCLEPAFVAARAGFLKRDGVPLHCLELRELHLPGQQLWRWQPPRDAAGNMELNGLRLGDGRAQTLDLEQLALRGLSREGDRLRVRELALSGFSGCLPRDLVRPFAPCYQAGRVQLERGLEVDFSGRVPLELRGVQIAGLLVSEAGYPAQIPAQLLQVETLSLGALAFAGGAIAAEGLELRGIASCVPEGYLRGVNLCAAVDVLSLSGSYRGADGLLELAALDWQALTLFGMDREPFFENGSARMQQVRWHNRELRLQFLELAQAAALGRREHELEFRRHAWNWELGLLQLEQLRYHLDARELDIARVVADTPRGILERDQAGDFPIRHRLAWVDGVGETAQRGAVREIRAPRLHYRIGEFSVTQGRFTWVDQAGRYEANLPVRRINLLMRDISSYDADPPASLLLNARPGGVGELQLAGEIDFKENHKWDARLKGYLRSVNLIPAGPYMAQLLGYKILQGQMDAVLDIRIVNDEVDAVADIVLNRLKLRRVRDAQHLGARTLIPLDIALLLMQDGQGDVRFRMPVSGNLYDPDFSFSYIFSHLLQRAIMEALLSYFTPVGVYTLARLAWARFRVARFAPVLFDPGSAELNAAAEARLDKLAADLSARPESRPGICGIANARDWNALYPQETPGLYGTRNSREAFYRHPPVEIHRELEQLAGRRSWRVQRYLLNAGITAEEFIQCAPDYNGRDFEQPRVEIGR